jgi:hypothetical protein
VGEQPCLAVDEFLALRPGLVTSDVDAGTVPDEQVEFDRVSRGPGTEVVGRSTI